MKKRRPHGWRWWAPRKGIGYERRPRLPLDGLLEADLVWEAGGENHLWRISLSGRDYLASNGDRGAGPRCQRNWANGCGTEPGAQAA
jgi:hypothetical protein